MAPLVNTTSCFILYTPAANTQCKKTQIFSSKIRIKMLMLCYAVCPKTAALKDAASFCS